MSTTDLFVEHLIAGILGVAWMALFSIHFLDFDTLRLDMFGSNEFINTALYIAASYPVGIFIDNLADAILSPWNNAMRRKFELDKHGITVGRLMMFVTSENMSRYFTYARTRIRIARASVLNFLLLTVSGYLFVSGNQQLLVSQQRTIVLTLILVSGSILTVWALFSWYNIANNYHRITRRVAIEAGIWKEKTNDEI